MPPLRRIDVMTVRSIDASHACFSFSKTSCFFLRSAGNLVISAMTQRLKAAKFSAGLDADAPDAPPAETQGSPFVAEEFQDAYSIVDSVDRIPVRHCRIQPRIRKLEATIRSQVLRTPISIVGNPSGAKGKIVLNVFKSSIWLASRSPMGGRVPDYNLLTSRLYWPYS